LILDICILHAVNVDFLVVILNTDSGRTSDVALFRFTSCAGY
jgi:hypothetical protein